MDFIVVLSEGEGPFREAMVSEWAANAPTPTPRPTAGRVSDNHGAKASAQHFQPRTLFSELRILDI